MDGTELNLGARYDAAPSVDAFIAAATVNQPLWETHRRRRGVAEDLVARGRPFAGWRLLAIAEDWCGDAVNSLPVIANWADAAGLGMRVLRRDEHLDVMDRFLTDGARAVPIVLFLDPSGAVRGSWGPRPADLQAWLQGPGRGVEKTERYRHLRTWYARDHGRTTLSELLRALEGAAVGVAA